MAATYIGPIFVITASLPLIAGIVPPNRLYGIRTKHSLQDPAHWYRLNRLGGALFALAGCTGLLGAALSSDKLVRLLAWLIPLLLVAAATVVLDRVLWRSHHHVDGDDVRPLR